VAVGLELKVAVDLCLVEFIGSEAELDLVSAANGNVNSKLLAFVSSLNTMALDFMAPGLTSHGLKAVLASAAKAVRHSNRIVRVILLLIQQVATIHFWISLYSKDLCAYDSPLLKNILQVLYLFL
jgi:hypothetical protein